VQICRGLRPVQRAQELERQIGQIALGEAGQVSRQPHDFWVTLVKAAKKEAQAKAALLASVQAQRDEMILEASTRATIDALVGEGFSASRTLRDHVKRWADMIRAEYAGDTLRQGSAREGARREALRHTRSERRAAEGGPSAQGHHRVIATQKVLQMLRELSQDPVIQFSSPQIRNTIQRSCSVATTGSSRLS
jgi:hypothetical protein